MSFRLPVTQQDRSKTGMETSSKNSEESGLKARVVNVRLPLDWTVSWLMLGVALLLCIRWNVAINFNLKIYLEICFYLIVVAVAATFVLVLGRELVNAIGRNSIDSETQNTRIEVYTCIARSLFLFFLCSWIYTHIKTGVLLGGDDGNDLWLREVDRWILGDDGWLIARRWLPDASSEFFSFIYFAFAPSLLISILYLACAGNVPRARKLTTAILLGYFIGVLSYFLLPAYGPAFIFESATCENLSEVTHEAQVKLLKTTNEVRQNPATAVVLPWMYIAAFPSLHFSHVIILAWYFRFSKLTLTVSFLFVCLTGVSTVYFAWHYAVDLLGGMAVACLAILLAERFSVISIPVFAPLGGANDG